MVLTSRALDRGFSGGVMGGVLAWRAVDRGFEPQSGQTKHYKMGICCFSDEPTIYRTRGEHANHYTTDAVGLFRCCVVSCDVRHTLMTVFELFNSLCYHW
jgi:hypothetical protein